MITIYYLDERIFDLSGFVDVSEKDVPAYVYQHLYQTLSNHIGEEVEGRLLYNPKKHLFALLHDGICIVDGNEEDEEEFMEEFLLFED